MAYYTGQNLPSKSGCEQAFSSQSSLTARAILAFYLYALYTIKMMTSLLGNSRNEQNSTTRNREKLLSTGDET